MKSIAKILALILLVVSGGIFAQDYHFSQFDASSVRMNAGMTGMFSNYSYKSGIMYRNQWRSLSVKPFSTFNLSYEMPVNRRWGVGGYITNFDGAKVYNEFNLVLSGAYRITKPGQDIHVLSTGLQIGFINKNINDKELTFNNQYQGGGFNPDMTSKENFERFSKFMPEINFGLYYEYGDWYPFKPYIGFSIFHISSPKNQFIETSVDPSRLPRRYLLHAGVIYKINQEYTLELKTREMWQGRASEYYMGFELDYLVDSRSNTKITGAFFYRVKDAVVLGIGMDYRNLKFMTTYDITTSGLKDHNSSFGGLEFSLRFAPRRGGATKY